MEYILLIKRSAKKTLQNLSRPDRNRITEKIVLLRKDPDDPTLDIKKLFGLPYYRLRVGDWRVIYDRSDDIRIISIEKN
ncbi:MAG TPA: type II toxin-antitoxin system RelE/ParE family toxin [Gammaproteobacteria bacterium]|nr:type II toxin-antitoxin system RelE/ParE family toxin [Gammaproteobacteria bacterium]